MNPNRTESLEDIQFAQNPEPRCACILLIDCSYSMTGPRINAVNHALKQFELDIKQNTLTALRAEISVVPFAHEIGESSTFISAQHFEAPTMYAGGGTKIAQAVVYALDAVEKRKETYKRQGVEYFRPLIILLTDGYPEHDTEAEIHAARQRVNDAETNQKAVVFTFGVNDDPGGPGADIGQLNRIVVRAAQELTQTTQIAGMFTWLSKSLSGISRSQPGDRITMAHPSFLRVG